MHIVKGDEVIVISGNEKGARGRVLAVFPDKQRMIVEKVNMIKRHQRAQSQQQAQGGIVEKEAPIHISKIALYDPKAKGPTRVKYRIRYEKDGDRQVKIKERISTKSGEVIEKPSQKGI